MSLPKTLPLSVCMIVRDEEKNLPGAIASVRTFAGEIIVVDTGSRDRTADVARSLGATVLSFPWQDDFSLARNVALQTASQEWILSLDADQRFAAASLPALTAALHRPCQGQIVTIDLLTDESATVRTDHYTALRLFRRDQRIRYRGRVHEDVSGSLLDIGSQDWPDSGITLRDFGYGDAAERQRKRERNLRLLEQALAEQPDDLFIAYKLAVSLPVERQAEHLAILAKALDQARQLTPDEARNLPFLPRLLAAAVHSEVEQGHLATASDLAQALLPTLGDSAYFIAGVAAARCRQSALADDLLQRFLQLDPTAPHLAAPTEIGANAAEACRWLGWLARTDDQLEQAQHWLARGLSTATPAQEMAIACEAIRVDLAARQITKVASEIDRLYPLLQASPGAFGELMLVSAELSAAVGDDAGAHELAQAALSPHDDRAAALVARLELKCGTPNDARLRQLLATVSGRCFDTLAVRLDLAQRLGIRLDFAIPPAAKELAARLH